MELSKEKRAGMVAVSLPGMYDLYYTPKKESIFGIEMELEPLPEELIRAYFMEYNGEVFGHYTGLASLNNIGGTTQVAALVTIKSNAIKAGDKYELRDNIYILGHRNYIIIPSEVEITKENYIYLELLDNIENMHDYFEEDIAETVKLAVNHCKLTLEGFNKELSRYSERTRGIINEVFAQ